MKYFFILLFAIGLSLSLLSVTVGACGDLCSNFVEVFDCSSGDIASLPFFSCPSTQICQWTFHNSSFCSSTGGIDTFWTGTCVNNASCLAPVCVSNQGQSCTSSANSCGQTNLGTIQCDGTCSATTPSNSSCDFTPPSGTLSVNPTTVAPNSNINATVTGFDNSDVAWLAVNFTGLSDGWNWHQCPGIQTSCTNTWPHSESMLGSHTYFGLVFDAADNSSFTNNAAVTVVSSDTTAPSGTLSVSPTIATPDQPIIISITAQDNIDVNQVNAFFNGTWNGHHQFCSGIQTLCTKTWPTSESVPGSYTYCGFVWDSATPFNDAQTTPFCTQVTVSSPPVISVSPLSHNYGNVNVGGFSNANFTVTNVGGGTLSGSVSTSGAPFSCIAGCSYSLGQNSSQTTTIRFSPTSSGTFNGNASFSGGVGATATLSGTGFVLLDQADCTSEAQRRGYVGGECYSTAFEPPPFTVPFCSEQTHADLLPDVGSCSGSLVGCAACHNCSSSPPSDTIPVGAGTCNVTISPRGWDTNDNTIQGYHKLNKGSNWREVVMDDNPDSICRENLKIRNTWTISGNQITITTVGERLGTTTHNLDAGFVLSVSGLGCSLSHPSLAPGSTTTSDWHMTTNTNTQTTAFGIVQAECTQDAHCTADPNKAKCNLITNTCVDNVAPTITIGEIKRIRSGLLGSKTLLATPETPSKDPQGRQWLRDGIYEISINVGDPDVDTSFRPVTIRSKGPDDLFDTADDRVFSPSLLTFNKFNIWVGSPDSLANDCVTQDIERCMISITVRDIAGNLTTTTKLLNIDYTAPSAQ